MMKKTILFLLISYLAMMNTWANAGALYNSRPLQKQYAKLNEMLWVKTLNEKQIELLKISFKSEHNFILIIAVKVIIIHKLTDFMPLLEKEIKRYNTPMLYFMKRIKTILKEDEKWSLETLFKFTSQKELKKARTSTHSESSWPEVLLTIPVIKMCRMLRSGSSLNTEKSVGKLPLLGYQKLLIEYSKLPEKEAINKIINRFNLAKKIILPQKSPPSAIRAAVKVRQEERNLNKVLQTYGEKPLLLVVQNFKKSKSLESSFLFLDYLRNKVILFSKPMAQKVTKILDSQKTILDQHYSNKIRVEHFRESLEAVLTGKFDKDPEPPKKNSLRQ